MKPSGRMAAFLILVGCDELTPCELAATVDAPALEIGLGEDGYEVPIADGDALIPDWGGQGGRHLFLAVRTSGFDPGNKNGVLKDSDIPIFRAELVGDDGITYVDQDWAFEAMEGDATGAELALGTFVVSEMSAEGLSQLLLLRVAGTDACGTELASEVQITLEMEGYGSTY